jgi:hypothetical protein
MNIDLFFLALSPTNVAPSMILEGENYDLKASINGQAYRGSGAFLAYPRPTRCDALAGLVYPVISCHQLPRVLVCDLGGDFLIDLPQ